MNVKNTSSVCFECQKDVFCTFWLFERLCTVKISKIVFCTLGMSKWHLFYVMEVWKKSSIHYECLNVLTSFGRYGCLKDVFCMLLVSQRHLLYVMGVLKISFVPYGCLKDVFFTLWMSLRYLLYLINVLKMISYVMNI